MTLDFIYHVLLFLFYEFDLVLPVDVDDYVSVEDAEDSLTDCYAVEDAFDAQLLFECEEPAERHADENETDECRV